MAKRKFLQRRKLEEADEFKALTSRTDLKSTQQSVRGLIHAEDQNIQEESFGSQEEEKENEEPDRWKSLTSRKDPSIAIHSKKAKTSAVTPSGAARRITHSHSVRQLSHKAQRITLEQEASRDLYQIIKRGIQRERKPDSSTKYQVSTTLPSEARSGVASRNPGLHTRSHTGSRFKRGPGIGKISEQTGQSVLQEMRDWHRDLSQNECHTDRTRSELQRSVSIYLPGKDKKLLSLRSQTLLRKQAQTQEAK